MPEIRIEIIDSGRRMLIISEEGTANDDTFRSVEKTTDVETPDNKKSANTACSFWLILLRFEIFVTAVDNCNLLCEHHLQKLRQ
ncbi:MAG: hypothetical protein EA391_10020 [Balneolaceae bacterium]|nr:MAG: hypothetical protein EA391_10020 [Balneolaceae bacterium]